MKKIHFFNWCTMTKIKNINTNKLILVSTIVYSILMIIVTVIILTNDYRSIESKLDINKEYIIDGKIYKLMELGEK